jgi:hypothetical protein
MQGNIGQTANLTSLSLNKEAERTPPSFNLSGHGQTVEALSEVPLHARKGYAEDALNPNLNVKVSRANSEPVFQTQSHHSVGYTRFYID